MKRLLTQLKLLVRYSFSGVSAFVVELVLLYTLLHTLSAPYYLSVAIAFCIATTANYAICHWWVFDGSGRRMHHEYIYFFTILLSGLMLAELSVMTIVTLFSISPVLARAISGVGTGLWSFYLNARFNFRSQAFSRRR